MYRKVERKGNIRKIGNYFLTRNKLLFFFFFSFFSFVKQPKRTWFFFLFWQNLGIFSKSSHRFNIRKKSTIIFFVKKICHIIVLENFMDIERKNLNKFIIYWKFGQVKRVKKKHYKADIIIKLKIFIIRQKLDFQQKTQLKIIAQNFCSPLTYRSWLVPRYR